MTERAAKCFIKSRLRAGAVFISAFFWISSSWAMSQDHDDKICHKLQIQARAIRDRGKLFTWPSRLPMVRSGSLSWTPLDLRKSIDLITDVYIDNDKNIGPIGRRLTSRSSMREEVIKELSARTILLDRSEIRIEKSLTPIFVYRLTNILLPRRSHSYTRSYVVSFGFPTQSDIARVRPPADSYPFHVKNHLFYVEGIEGNIYSIDIQQIDPVQKTGLAPFLIPICQLNIPNIR